MVKKSTSHTARTMYQKSMRRGMRRCVSMVKIAGFLLCMILMSGFLHATVDQSLLLEDSTEATPFLFRHQRRVRKDDHFIIDQIQLPDATNRNSSGKTFSLEVSHDDQIRPKMNIQPLDSAKEISKPIYRPIGFLHAPLYMTIDYKVLLKENFKRKEKENQIEWTKKIKKKKFDHQPPNPTFIFHNKLPKSGSSTMNNILKKLSKSNHFNFLKMETSDFQTSDDAYLIKELKSKIKEPFLLLKHHRFLNFTRNNQPQPTYINVMRDPIEWFTSRYYFSRYGWERKPGCRKADCGMSEEDRLMEIDDCVKKRHRECMNPWMYIQFFCGTAPECYNVSTLEQKEKATEIAKRNILDEYYTIGVLEQFEDTLNLLEFLLPTYFKEATSTWKSEFVQKKQQMTRTTYKKEMSEESKEFFRNGPLHYEIELYNFARELFNEKLSYFNIKSTVSS